jgi:hypothetical protein
VKRLFGWRTVRSVLLASIAVFVAIQLVPVRRSNPPVEADVAAPANVHAILRRACYDCHSHETVWPWYTRIAPVSWLVVRDVEKGREELNFSTWNRLASREQFKELRKTWNEVAEREMPPWLYVRMHGDATLSVADRAALREWTRQAAPEHEGDDER